MLIEAAVNFNTGSGTLTPSDRKDQPRFSASATNQISFVCLCAV